MYTISELQAWVEKAIKAIPLDGKPEELYSPVSYMMSIGGKRLRPLLSLLSYNMFNDKIGNEILLPALGLEIFHGFTLVHDDIMDNAAMRRKSKTVHNKWNTNIAILSGDVMCIMAYKYLGEAGAHHHREILQLFGRTAAQVCEGQQLDMNYESKPVITEEDYLAMIALKTAVLIAAAAKIGAIAGGAAATDAEKMYDFGYHLGMAFQIQDDLLDAYGNADNFGKTIGSDIVTNKKTFLLTTAQRLATGKVRTELDLWLANKGVAADEKIKGVLAIYDKLEVRRKAEDAINNYFNRAAKILAGVQVDTKRKEQITGFAQQLINREK